MKTWIFCGVMAGLVLCLTGCSELEEEPPPSRRQRAAAESLGPKPQAKKDKTRRDPLDDMFFGIGKRNDTPRFSSEGLNSDERSMVDAELRRQDDDMKALKKRHQSFDEDRKKRKEWVYGL